MLLASDEHGHLIEMPMITGLRASRLRLAGIVESNFKTQRRTVPYDTIEASFGEHLLDVTQTHDSRRGETSVPPDRA